MKFVGWEKNSKGIFCPKYVNLSKTMDSKKYISFFENMLAMFLKTKRVFIIDTIC